VVAGQLVAEPVLEGQLREVEPPRQREEQIGTDRERVGRIDAEVVDRAVDRDRRRGIHEAGVGHHPVVIERSDRGLRAKADPAPGRIDADEQVVLAVGDRRLGGELRGGAVAGLPRVALVARGVVGVVERDRHARPVEHGQLAPVVVGRAQRAGRCQALRPVALIAIDRPGPVRPRIDRPGQPEVSRQRVLSAQGRHEQSVLGLIGRGEERGAVRGEQLLGQRAVPGQPGVGSDQREIGGRARVPVRRRHEAVLRARWRPVAPAVLVEPLRRGEDPEPLGVRTGVGADQLAPPRAVQQRRVQPGVREPGLALQRQRTAQRVAAEDRVRAGDQVDRPDRVRRDEIPVDRVAERLVQPDAIEVHRQALRGPEQRGREEAAVLHVRLQRVALHRVEVDAAERLPGVRRQVEALVVGEILGRDRLDVRRHVILGQARAVQRRRRGHVDHERRAGVRRWWRRRRCLLRFIGARGRRHQRCEHRDDRGTLRVGHDDTRPRRCERVNRRSSKTHHDRCPR
jgi:hypothetical protein